MENDLYIKISSLTNKGRSILYFDYINKRGIYIGNIIITSDGKMEWYIIDKKYEKNIISAVKEINGFNSLNMLEYNDNQTNILRWENAWLFIENHGYHTNFYKNICFYEENDKGNRKRLSR